jgi:hypothetical protein
VKQKWAAQTRKTDGAKRELRPTPKAVHGGGDAVELLVVTRYHKERSHHLVLLAISWRLEIWMEMGVVRRICLERRQRRFS